MTLLPLSKNKYDGKRSPDSWLVYGSDDGGTTVHNDIQVRGLGLCFCVLPCAVLALRCCGCRRHLFGIKLTYVPVFILLLNCEYRLLGFFTGTVFCLLV